MSIHIIYMYISIFRRVVQDCAVAHFRSKSGCRVNADRDSKDAWFIFYHKMNYIYNIVEPCIKMNYHHGCSMTEYKMSTSSQN